MPKQIRISIKGIPKIINYGRELKLFCLVWNVMSSLHTYPIELLDQAKSRLTRLFNKSCFDMYAHISFLEDGY